MNIQPFPERRPRSPVPGRPRARHERRAWDDKGVDPRDRLRIDAVLRQAYRRVSIAADHQSATEDQYATVEHVEHPAQQQAPTSPTSHFGGPQPSAHALFTAGPTLPALRPLSPSPQTASPHAGTAPRAIQMQFQWSEPPDATNPLGRAPPIPARSPRRGEIQFQWQDAPDHAPTVDRIHAPADHAVRGSSSPVRQSDRDEYDDPPSHGHPSPRTMPTSSTFRPNPFGAADWRERLPLRPVLEQPRWDITRSDWLGRPPRTSAEVDYYGISEEPSSSPVSSSTTSSSYGNNFGLRTSAAHLAGTGTGSIDLSSPYDNETTHTSRATGFPSPRDLHSSSEDSISALASSSSRARISDHRVVSSSSEGSSADGEGDGQSMEISTHSSSGLSSTRDRHHRHNDRSRLSTHHNSQKRPQRGGQDELGEQPTKRSKHRSSHHSAHPQAHRDRHHSRDDSTHSSGHDSSHSSHNDRGRQYDNSVRSSTDTRSDLPTNSSHGRAASVSERQDTTQSTMTASQRLNRIIWDSDDSDRERDSSMIDASTEPKFRHSPFQPDIKTETILCAISESRAGDFVGIAILNLTTGRAEISHIINDDKFQYQRLIDVLSNMEHLPHSFIVPEKLAKPGEAKSYLVRCLRKEFPSASIKPLQRGHWSETEGKRIVSESALDSEREAILAVLEKEFYVANAISAVFEYARRQLGVTITPHSTCIKYAHPADTLRLDRTAVCSLELIKPSKDGHSKSTSVFKIMDRTYTPAGRRLLRMSLLGPSTDRSEIAHRQDAVEEFTNKQEFLSDVGKGLKALHRIDMERVIAWMFRPETTPEYPLAIGAVYSRNGVVLPCHDDLQAAESDLNHLLMLKEFLEGVVALHKILAAESCSSTLVRWLGEQLSPEKLREARSVIQVGINEDAGFSSKPIDTRNNRIWAIRAPPGSGLEQSRASYRDATNSLSQHVDELNKVLGDFMGEEGKLRQDSDRRSVLSFSISVVMQKLPEYVRKAGIHDDFGFRLPQEWAHRLPGTNEFTAIRKQSYYVVYTAELFEMSRETQLYADMATEESDKYVVELRRRLTTTDRLPMFEMNDAVAILDMLCSFAQLSASLNYIRPEMSDQLVLQGARNPIVETRMQNYIPSDVYLGDDSHRCLVLNGGNMSGKSTLVKTVGLIQIMGQMGCFVPANYAQLPICKQLFTRLSTEDKPENNLGTFGVETTDMNLILRHATEDSLVLIDELGRGTSHSNGLALAKAMVLDLVETKARLMFATHFTEIGPELRDMKPTMVTCRHFVAQADADPNTETRQITITHTLAPGPMQYRDYGIDLSRRFLPENVTGFAHQVSDFLRSKTNDASEDAAARNTTSSTNMLGKLKLGIRDIVKRLAKSSEDVDSATLAIEMKKLQIAASKREEGLPPLVTTPPPSTHHAITHMSRALPPPMPRLPTPKGGHAGEQLMRWREEEDRVMYDNTHLPSQKKGAPEGVKETGAKAAEPPRRVYRGRVEARSQAAVPAAVAPTLGAEMELDDPLELSQMLGEARGKVHAWLREDGL